MKAQCVVKLEYVAIGNERIFKGKTRVHNNKHIEMKFKNTCIKV